MIGPIGRTVIANTEELRKTRGFSLRDLAAKLAELGRPIGDTVLHRQSQGKRRVDADDLVALSIALGVNPNALLFPRDTGRFELIELTPVRSQRAWAVWGWADGRMPLPELVPGEKEAAQVTIGERADFTERARPAVSAERRDHPVIREIDQLADRVLAAVREQDGGKREWHARHVRNGLQRVQIAVDEMLDEPPEAGE